MTTETELPKCKSRWGHKFAARYSVVPCPPSANAIAQLSMWCGYSIAYDAAHREKRIYERDICIRCGVTVERP